MDRRVCFETLKSSPRRTPRRSVDISEPAPAPNRACPTTHLGPAHPSTTGQPHPLSGAGPTHYQGPAPISTPASPIVRRSRGTIAITTHTMSKTPRRLLLALEGNVARCRVQNSPKSRYLLETSTQLQKQSLSRGLVPAEPSTDAAVATQQAKTAVMTFIISWQRPSPTERSSPARC